MSAAGESGQPQLGVLGTGQMGVRLAALFARAGRRVLLASRDRARAERIVAELAIPGLFAGSHDEALRAPAVLPAIFMRDGLLDLLRELAPRLDGKLLVDIANPFNADYSDFILPWDTSAAEQVQAWLPRTRVIGAFKNVFAQVFDAPLLEAQQTDVFLVGDDAGAKAEFLALAAGTPFRYLDAGALIHARTVERLTLVMGRLGRQIGSYPRMNWRLLGDAAPAAAVATAIT